ncbi:MAG: SDR family oxidoreductase [Dehalococcoidales bacterium]|nr:SDR family oxidoreductase [Dehalococcoidales bacterium]
MMQSVALVTGSTHNMGKAIAETLSADGHYVIITSRNADEASAVADSLPHPGTSYAVDFSDAGEIAGLFSFIRTDIGRLDILVNSLATTRNESILECSLENWDYTVDTNLRSYFLCIKYAAEMMKTQGGGNIVNMTVSSDRGVKNKFSYVVSKGAIYFLTRAAALDLAPFNIRVNAVGSGLVGSPVGSKENPERNTRSYENPRIPAGHTGDPMDVARAVRFLLSEEASYIYGAVLPVDGGMNIGL